MVPRDTHSLARAPQRGDAQRATIVQKVCDFSATTMRTMFAAALRARPKLAAAGVGLTTAAAGFSTVGGVSACESNVADFSVHVRYFGGVRGAAEVIRHVMSLAEQPWTEDEWALDMSKMPNLAAASPGFAAARDSGDLDLNLGRAPVVVIQDGKDRLELGQSKTIERYLSRRFGLFGETEHEGAHIDMITEHIRDVKDKYKTAKDKTAFLAVSFPEYMEKLDMAVRLIGGGSGGGPPLIGKNLSLADVSLFVLMKDFFEDQHQAAADEAIRQCMRLQRSLEETGQHPGIASYRAKRQTSNVKAA